MVYGVLSDVHSNLEALKAVLAELERLDVDRLLFLGDIVGYGADPSACVSLLEGAADESIRGNHDRIVAGVGDVWGYGYSSDEVREADLWNRQALTEECMRRVRALAPGPRLVDRELVICHGSPRDEDEYLLSWEAVEQSVEHVRRLYPAATLCLFGHTHAAVLVQGGESRAASGDGVAVRSGALCLVNPGSVGQPRDGDPRASFGVWDAERRVYRNHRVRYDIAAAQRKIVSAGLPRRFADRLRWGR